MGFLSGLFGSGGNESSSNSTTSSNDSSTNSTVDSHNIATNTSNNSTVNDTNTLTQDRRLVVDNGGYGVSADNSTITTTTTDSNNSSTSNFYTTTTTDYGSVAAAIASNVSLAGQAVDVSKYVVGASQQMLGANLDFLQHLSDNSQSSARSAISEVAAASANAINQVVGIAAKPLNANDPQRLVIIVALGVVGLVFFSKLKG